MLNNVSLMGRFTKEPEYGNTQSGKEYCKFCLANSTKTANNENTDFIDCISWGKTANFIKQWFVKGDMIAVTGRLATRTYESKDGHKVKVTEVLVLTADFCGSKKTQDAQQKPAAVAEPIAESNLPFDFEGFSL